MLELIHTLLPWLALAALTGLLTGWCWHCVRKHAAFAALQAERDDARARLDAATLDAKARAATRLADLQAARRNIVSERVVGQNAQAVADAALADDARDSARIRTLEAELASARDRANVLAAERASLEVRVGELAKAPQALGLVSTGAISDDDLNRLQWQNRYLSSRVRYFETRADEAVHANAGKTGALGLVGAGAVAAVGGASAAASAGASASAPSEDTLRQGWMLRYYQARSKWLSELGSVGAPAAKAEAEADAGDAQAKAQRLQWRARYLESRVKYLEDRLSQGGGAATLVGGGASGALGLVGNAGAGAPVSAPVEAASAAEAAAEGEIDVAARPPALEGPIGGRPDDLRELAGIGPKNEAILHSLGIFHFHQIAAWTPENIAWVDQYLRFNGRIEREKWVEQADALARGEMTEGKRKYLEGEHS